MKPTVTTPTCPVCGAWWPQGLQGFWVIAAARSQNAVVQHLQKFVENPGMSFLDFVEQKDAEGLFPNCVGKFASSV
jgi:hypothetical protein